MYACTITCQWSWNVLSVKQECDNHLAYDVTSRMCMICMVFDECMGVFQCTKQLGV
jgi:hypothetical protein